ncbi:MAG: hypothetical protein NW224_17030 [Leptolyngbyaceae cyanobacterium bins.302]|nr:hypothetical protein [Leptolyngbyaceae cyanobacterium bins.302]
MNDIQTELSRIIGHKFADAEQLPEHTSTGFEYIVGSNGIYVRAIRPSIQVTIPVSTHQQPLKGLADIRPNIEIAPKIPESLLLEMWSLACQACSTQSLEILFHLTLEQEHWRLTVPNQQQSPNQCQPTNTSYGSTAHRATVEIHSHGQLPAFFSPTDDQDEATGFRVYGVLGKVRSSQPEMVLRVCIFGHCCHLPIHQVFDIEPDSTFLFDLTQHYLQQHNSLPFYQCPRHEQTAEL